MTRANPRVFCHLKIYSDISSYGNNPLFEHILAIWKPMIRDFHAIFPINFLRTAWNRTILRHYPTRLPYVNTGWFCTPALDASFPRCSPQTIPSDRHFGIRRITVDYNLIEVNQGYCWSVEERKFLKDPIPAEESGLDHTESVQAVRPVQRTTSKVLHRDPWNSLSESQISLFYEDFLRLLKYNQKKHTFRRRLNSVEGICKFSPRRFRGKIFIQV